MGVPSLLVARAMTVGRMFSSRSSLLRCSAWSATSASSSCRM